jgi:DNA-binding CsgD family transcriptional regulator
MEPAALDGLRPAQRRMLLMFASGLTPKEIAREINMNVIGVRFHITMALRLLDETEQTDLINRYRSARRQSEGG